MNVISVYMCFCVIAMTAGIAYLLLTAYGKV